MEHSCRPNAIYIDNDRTKFRTITAAKDIEKGEPITIPYYDASICDSTRRQELGVARLGVSCPCSLCTAAAISGEAFNAVGNSDHWRRCMQRLLEFIDVLHDLWSDAVAADPQGPWDFDIGCDAVSDGKNDTHWQLCADQTTRELILLINDGSLPKGEAHSIPLCQRVPASGLISLAGLVRRAAVVVILLAQNEGIVDGVTYYAAKKLKDYAIFWNNEARTRHKYGDATMIGGIYFARALIRLFEAFFAADPNLKELRQYVLDAEEVLGDMGLDIRHNGCFGVEQIFAAEQGLTWKEGEWGTIGTKGIINASDARIWDRLVPWEDLR